MQAVSRKLAEPDSSAGGNPSGQGTLGSPGARKALSGFFISGVLLAFPGAILLSWQHHLSSEYATVGLYFLGLIAGVLSSVWMSPPLLARKGIGWTLSLACGMAAAGLIFLAFMSPPVSFWWRIAGLLVIGASAGLLHTGIFQAISPMYRHDPVATVNVAGIFFGLGCLAVALLISATFYLSTPLGIQIAIALVPALFCWGYARSEFQPPTPQAAPSRSSLSGLKNLSALLLSLLLFFQFGNEWAIAGWLPLYLTQRLGISPATAIRLLALYWLALLVGRVVAQWILPRVRHARLLLGSVLTSVFGCLVLIATDNLFGATTGILMVGAGFAPVYPLVVERIGRRFPYFHPGFYNGIFSIAIAAGLVAPCLLGFLAPSWGVWIVMGLPLAGSVMVFLLLLLIGLEARLTAPARAAR